MAGTIFAHSKLLMLVFIGGGMGSVSRYILGKWLNPLLSNFPIGTLVINTLACFILGSVWAYADQRPNQDQLWAFLIIGFCGGFSTFSTFSFEIIQLIKSGAGIVGLAYLLLSVILGICFTVLGYALFK